jgi:hypothetical protein
VLFCDLQRASFDGADLSGVEFVGCRLDGASFQHTVLRGARIVACFSADDRPPVDFRGAVWDDAVVVDSHLHALADRAPTDDWRWPAEVAAAAASTLAARNDHRYEACKRLGVLGDQRPFGIVARALGQGVGGALDRHRHAGAALPAHGRPRRSRLAGAALPPSG